MTNEELQEQTQSHVNGTYDHVDQIIRDDAYEYVHKMREKHATDEQILNATHQIQNSTQGIYGYWVDEVRDIIKEGKS